MLGEAAEYQVVRVFARDEFKYDIELNDLNNFDSVVPDYLDVKDGDWLRFTLDENPSTGYRWLTDAATEQFPTRLGGKVKEIFNFFQGPTDVMPGSAGGKRIIVIEIREDAKEFSLGIKKSGRY